MAYRYILFDLDGTLLCTFGSIVKAFGVVARQHGLPVLAPEVISTFHGVPLKSRMTVEFGISEDVAEQMLKLYTGSYNQEDTFVFEGMRELLGELADAGCRIAVPTLKEGTLGRETLEHFGLSDAVEYVASPPWEGGVEKADLIRDCLSYLGCENPMEAVMVGDTIVDAEGAEETGVPFVTAAYREDFHYMEDDSWKRYPTVHIARTVDDLRDYLMRSIEGSPGNAAHNRRAGDQQ